MDYLSQKIKLAPKIAVSQELHRRIMRRIFYQQFRYPLWALIAIALTRIFADIWQVFNHSFTKVILTFAQNFGLSPAGIGKILLGVLDKALLHPDLIAAIIIDFGLFSYVFYILSHMKGADRDGNQKRFYLNPLGWFKYLLNLVRIAK